jgi:uncharacterized membrane protein
MKKTSNKIIGGLILLGIVAGLAFIIFVKIKAGDSYKNKPEYLQERIMK